MINDTLIERYFSKRLTPNETLEFEKLYTNDPNFKQEVDFLKNLKSVAETEDDIAFKNQLAAHEADCAKQEKKTTFKWLKPLFAATGLILIVLTINFFLNSNIDEDQLFSSYFEPSKNVSSPIVRGSDTETTLNNAFIAYGEADYEQAIVLFQKSYEASQNSELLFYEANAFLALEDTQNAILKFKAHLKYTDQLTHRSHWYLALAYLKTHDIENAKQELKSLIHSGEPFKRSEANSLLKKLN